MRAFAAILQREVFERRLVVLLALALGLIAVLVPLVPGVVPGGVTPADLRGGVALGLASLLTALLAIFLGGSVIAGDLAERRLGFYFSRPLPGWTIWAGKIGAAVILILIAGLLVLAPAALLGGNLNLDGTWGTFGTGNLLNVTGPGVFAAWALALLVLLLISHAVSVIVRARSPWALLDLAALAVCGGLAGWAVRRLIFEGTFFRVLSWDFKAEDRFGIATWMDLGLFLAVLLALAVAGALQVVHGRTDLRRAHRVLSQGLWGMLLTAVLLFVGLTAWVLAAEPGDLRGVFEATAGPGLPGEHWIAFNGPAARRPGYDPSFLYDLDSGRTFRTRFGLVSYSSGFGTTDPMVRFSADGRRAVWLEYDGVPFDSPVSVHRLDLDRPGVTPERTLVSYPTVPRGFALSPDGRRVAAYEVKGARLTVAEVDGGRLLAAARYDSRYEAPRLAFVSPNRLRLLDAVFVYYFPSRVVSPTEIFELDLTSSSPRPRKTGEIPEMAGGVRDWSLSPDGDRLLLHGGKALQLSDARTGMPLATLGSGSARGTFLHDGRIAVVETLGSKYEHELRIFPADGHAEPLRVPFPRTISVIVADQPAPGLLRVVTRHTAPDLSYKLWQVDLEHGTAKPTRTPRLAHLDFPLLSQARVDLQGADGVIWGEPWTSRVRVLLKGS